MSPDDTGPTNGRNENPASWELRNAIRDHVHGILPSEKYVLDTIASYQNQDSGLSWPSIATIADACGLKQRRTRELITSLEKRGLLVRHERGSGGKTTRYHVPLPTPESATTQEAKPRPATAEQPQSPPATSRKPQRQTKAEREAAERWELAKRYAEHWDDDDDGELPRQGGTRHG